MPRMRTIKVTDEVYEALMQIRGQPKRGQCKTMTDKLNRFIPDVEDEFAEDERQSAEFDDYNEED